MSDQEGEGGAATPPRVLCVDDEPNVLHALRRALGGRFAVTTAVQGEAGLEALHREGPFAVVVSDMRMPGMDGGAFLGRVHAHAPDTARILLTGQADVESAAAAVNAGQLFRFLTKPCGPDTLRRACDEGAAHHRRMATERLVLERTLRGGITVLLDMVAAGAPLAELLAAVAVRTEGGTSGMRCAISVCEDRGDVLRCLAAPSLPAGLREAVTRLALHPPAAPCAEAAVRREPVVVCDLASDPRWPGWRDVALAHGIRACRSVPVFAADGAVLGTLAVYYDEPRAPTPAELGLIEAVTRLVAIACERVRAARVAAVSAARFRTVFDHAAVGIALADREGQVIEANAALRSLLGGSATEGGGAVDSGGPCAPIAPRREDPAAQIGRAMRELAGGADLSAAGSTGASAGASVEVERRFLRRDGQVLWGRLTTSRVPEADGVSGLVGVLQDVTARKALEAELEQRASIDGLTGLPNRTRFSGAVARALASAPRAGGLVAVLVLDLDNFRTVNDSLGHVVGDRLLVLAAKRLLTATRAQDTVARLGGDEFAVLIEGAADVAAVAAIAGRITAAFADPFHVSDTTVLATASVGIATASTAAEGTPAATPEALLRDADAAMYGAKAHGKSRVALFEPAMHAAALVRLQLEADLRRAVDYQEFLLLYQPIVRLETGALAGLEALVRWQHPARGMLGPAAFIQAAEDTGLIVPLGAWVLREACRQLRAWQRAYGPDAPPAVTVNLSGRQLHGEGSGERLAAEVRAALDASGLAPAALVLEITESTAMQHTEANLAALAALKALGVKLAIDDFGTGYSSLAYLERFPLDVLKIDKSFVDHVTAGGKGLVLARAIIALGDALGLRTVAEGIERPEQAEALRALGCHLGQGYLFARPLVPADVDHLLGGSAKT